MAANQRKILLQRAGHFSTEYTPNIDISWPTGRSDARPRTRRSASCRHICRMLEQADLTAEERTSSACSGEIAGNRDPWRCCGSVRGRDRLHGPLDALREQGFRASLVFVEMRPAVPLAGYTGANELPARPLSTRYGTAPVWLQPHHVKGSVISRSIADRPLACRAAGENSNLIVAIGALLLEPPGASCDLVLEYRGTVVHSRAGSSHSLT